MAAGQEPVDHKQNPGRRDQKKVRASRNFAVDDQKPEVEGDKGADRKGATEYFPAPSND